MREYRELLQVVLFTPGLNGRWGLPVLFWGEPGTGKTAVVEATSSAAGLPVTTLIASIREPSDFGGLPVPREQAGKTYIEMAPPAWGKDIEIENNGRAVVFLDEITTCAPATQAALLRMVLSGACGDYTLPRGVRFVAAANPVSSAAGGWDLAAPLANRFGHIAWSHDATAWCDWLLSGGDCGASSDAAAETETAEQHEARVMERWAEEYARARGVVAAFVRARRELLFAMPRQGEKNRGKAWPSPRTWEMAARALAGCACHGASEQTRDVLVAAFVGDAAAGEFAAFIASCDLPDPAAVLDGRVAWTHDAHRLDRTVAVLGSCAALVCEDSCANRKARVAACWTLIGDVVDAGAADVAVPAAKVLIPKRLQAGVAEAQRALVALNPVLAAAGMLRS